MPRWSESAEGCIPEKSRAVTAPVFQVGSGGCAAGQPAVQNPASRDPGKNERNRWSTDGTHPAQPTRAAASTYSW
ncbi:hypothetical protein GCM10027515_01880 [Schumannella luteola]